MTTTEYHTSNECTGSSGDANRVLTLNNIKLTVDTGLLVFVNGLATQKTTGFTISHSATSSQITFITKLWDNANIVVYYNTTSTIDDSSYGLDIVGTIQKGLNKIFALGAITSDINIISYTFDTNDYDDVTSKTITGSYTTSGIIFPMKSTQGSTEAMLLEQGKILTSDKILYTGSINTSGNLLFDINNNKYTIIPDGVTTYTLGTSEIYNKIYLRKTLGGSLF